MIDSLFDDVQSGLMYACLESCAYIHEILRPRVRVLRAGGASLVHVVRNERGAFTWQYRTTRQHLNTETSHVLI